MSLQFLEIIESLDPNLKHRIKTKTITPPPLRMLAILALNPDQLSTIKKCVQNDYTLPCAINALSSSPDATIHAQTSDGLTILPEDTQSLSRH